MYKYRTKGTCSREIHFDVVDGKVRDVSFVSGCRGNLQGIGRLVEGMEVNEVITRLKGVRCQGDTSCPDQLSRALEAYLEAQK